MECIMKQNNLKVNELLKDKPYLLEENYCPNVGYFPNGPSKYIQQILNGSDVYRYDIYSYRDDDDRIINLGGGSPIKYKTYKYVKKDILKYLNSNSLYNYKYFLVCYIQLFHQCFRLNQLSFL